MNRKHPHPIRFFLRRVLSPRAPALLLLSLGLSSACMQSTSIKDKSKEFEVNDAENAADAQASAPTAGEGIAAFNKSLQNGQLPAPENLKASDFFGQYRFPLRPPACELDLCLQSSVAQRGTLFSNQPSTVVLVGLNSAIDPSSLASSARHIVLAIDASEAMQGSTLQALQSALRSLRQQLKDKDRLSLIAIGKEANVLASGVSRDDPNLERPFTTIGKLNLYDGLRSAYDLLEGERRPDERSILVALIAGTPSAGIVDQQRLRRLTESYAELGHDFHAIALGESVDKVKLRELTEAGAGHFYFVQSSTNLAQVMSSPDILSKVSLARDIDVRVKLSDRYRLRSASGAKIFKQTDEQLTLRIPSFDLIAQTNSESERRSSQRIVLLELARQEDGRAQDIAEISFSYAKGKDERVEGPTALLLAPSAPDRVFFQDDAARRAYGLLSLYMGFKRALELVIKEDYVRALLMLNTLRSGLEAWLERSAHEPVIAQELNNLERLIKLIEPKSQSKDELPEGTPLIDPIIDAANDA